jgi:ribonuclease HI
MTGKNLSLRHRQNALREIEMKKPALMVYTDGKIKGEERGVGVYCEAKGFKGRYKIEKDVPITSMWAYQILMKAMKGDRHNKIAMRILQNIRNARKQMTIKWIPAHVGLEGNEKAGILAKYGARKDMLIDYALQLTDVYRILEETQWHKWNNWGPTLKMRRKSNRNRGTKTQNYQVSTHTR